MIKRLNRNNDLRDYIYEIPKGIIDRIHTVKYYIYGHEEVSITPSFEKKGEILTVIIPAEDLVNLPEGMLYRKEYYSESDERYQDESYDLELVQSLDIWLYGDDSKKAYEELDNIEPYLYEIAYENLDYEYAKKYFKKKEEIVLGGCSAASMGNKVVRNYDWKYNNEASFLIRTKNTLGVGGSVAALTEDFVESGAYNVAYKILPFMLQDGINEAGLFCEINVVPANNNFPSIPTKDEREEICDVMLVRYILDKFKSVNEAVNYIKKYVKIYNILGDYEVHYMLKDADTTVVLEVVDGIVEVIDSNVSTNFNLYGVEFNEDGTVNTPATANEGLLPIANYIQDYGTGLERWNIIKKFSGDDLKDLMVALYYSNAYKEDAGWYSEFVGGNITVNTPSDDEDFQARVEEYRQAWEERDRESGDVWHTVHSCIYDLGEKSIKVYNQEGEEEHTFYLNQA